MSANEAVDGILRALRARIDGRAITELPEGADRQMARLARKLLNHLCRSGIPEAQDLLARIVQPPADCGELGENRPVETTAWDPRAADDETFRIAAAHWSEAEMVGRIRGWIQDDLASFLLEALERWVPISELREALRRFRALDLQEEDLSFPMRTALRVALARRFFTDSPDFIRVAKQHVGVADYHDIAMHVVASPRGRGRLGGKCAGMVLATRIVRGASEHADLLGDLRAPRSWYIASDGLLDFIEHNHLEDLYDRKYLEGDAIRMEYPHVVQLFKHSSFPPQMVKGLAEALDDFGATPLIVRSSSLLEDGADAAFSGKYKSLFLANQGTRQERLAALLDAVAEVYASVFAPDPLHYRAERGLLDLHEEMGILIQEVVGARVGPYFLPAYSGVAFSNNEFRWSARIRREDGLIRMVPGLGTRAVDRTGDDYPVLIAPGQPGIRANAALDETIRYSARRADAIDLEKNALESVPLDTLFRHWGGEYPAFADVVSTVDGDALRRPIRFESGVSWIVTFDGLTTRTRFVARMQTLLALLSDRFGTAIDLEFASDGAHLYLLQCRPQSRAADIAPSVIPPDLPAERIVFSAGRHVSNGRVPEITHVVYVDPLRYAALTSLADLQEVGRAVGKLNALLPRRRFLLMGPGRWGSRGDIKLGVRVAYSDINNTAMLIEIARKSGPYVPDVSFGTHFFQDLVEASIRYLPLYPDEPGTHFSEAFFTESRNCLADLLPEHARLSNTLRVIDVPAVSDGRILRVLQNADQNRAVAFLDAR